MDDALARLAHGLNYPPDGTLTARVVSADKMEGEFTRQTSKGIVHIPVSFDPHQKPPATSAWKGPSLTGDWIFTWPNDKGAEKTTRATFKQDEAADDKAKSPRPDDPAGQR